MVHVFQKQLGETMTECMDRMRTECDLAPSIPVTYTGRLDPAASGVCIFLSGDDRYNKDAFQGLDKVYHVTILCGIATDTGDLLGLVTELGTNLLPDQKNLPELLQTLTGPTTAPFPAFSARRVAGMPLWQHSRNADAVRAAGPMYAAHATMALPAAPIHTTTIHTIELINITAVSGDAVKSSVRRLCEQLSNHDFRQPKILESWEQIHDNEAYPCINVRVHCSSGSYMRVLAQRIGELLGCPALASSITRESVGEYI